MILIFSLFCFVVFFSHLEINIGIGRNLSKKLFLSISFLFFLLSFLRWEYGGDWDNYYAFFERFDWDSFEGYEPVYSFLLVLAKNIINSYTFALFVFSTILFYFQTKGVLQMAVLPLTSLLFLTGTYVCNIGYTRQYIAVVLCFYSTYYIQRQRFCHYLLLVALAVGFHYSALIFLPSWWIYKIRLSTLKILFTILICISLSFLFSQLLQKLGDSLGGEYLYRINYYIDEGQDVDHLPQSPVVMIAKSVINRSLVLAVGVYLYGRNFDENVFFRGVVNLYIFGTVLFYLTSPISMAFARASWYFDFMQILIIPYIFLILRRKISRFLMFGTIVVFLLYKLYINNSFDDNYHVYKFIPEIESVLQL